MLKDRVITALLVASGLLLALWLLPSTYLLLVIAAVLGLAAREWARLSNLSSPLSLAYIAIMLGLVLCLLLLDRCS